MKTFKIHLIRHGIAEGSTEGQYIGHTDVPLTEDGEYQLRSMMREFEYPAVQAVLCSPLNRCLETARILYPDIQPLIFDNLIEYDFGEFEGLTADDLKGEPAFAEWLAGGPEAAAPFGESNEAFQKRVTRAFYDIVNGVIKTDNDSVAIITHGGVIMTIMQTFAIPEAPMHEWLTPNGCGYTLNVIPSIWGNTAKAEAFAEIPMKPRADEEEDDENINWDQPIDPDEFRGFYTPEENR
ncbi:MAG: histidine phosphatase family protein [Clostridia bacterium]|nr:histidine phosphatase family protein [Clostridia bacterium]MBR5423827.1 histidine phosphatase family protein [Clostridia bacterium]